MINNDMEPKNESTPVEKSVPNESTGIYVRGFVKISDPKTGQVIVETSN